MSRFGSLLHGSAVTPKDLEIMQDKLLFDRLPVLDRYLRFTLLLALSGIISTYGVISDSTATVIGAMIVAPLMTPIMAVSLSAVSGDTRNIIRSLLTASAGAALVIGMAWALAAVLPGDTQIAGNSQVAARIAPRLIDLIIALAAGAAGAFASGREDVSDALPGVAIAISLVPPLSVVGICLSAGEYGPAWGALLLFLTNFLAIVISGLIVFALMGYGGVALNLAAKATRRWTTTVIVIATVAIVIPLSAAGLRVGANEVLQQQANQAIDKWLAGTEFETYSVKADGHKVDAVIAGSGDVPPLQGLLDDLKARAGDVQLNIKVVPETTIRAVTPP